MSDSGRWGWSMMRSPQPQGNEGELGRRIERLGRENSELRSKLRAFAHDDADSALPQVLHSIRDLVKQLESHVQPLGHLVVDLRARPHEVSERSLTSVDSRLADLNSAMLEVCHHLKIITRLTERSVKTDADGIAAPVPSSVYRHLSAPPRGSMEAAELSMDMSMLPPTREILTASHAPPAYRSDYSQSSAQHRHRSVDSEPGQHHGQWSQAPSTRSQPSWQGWDAGPMQSGGRAPDGSLLNMEHSRSLRVDRGPLLQDLRPSGYSHQELGCGTSFSRQPAPDDRPPGEAWVVAGHRPTAPPVASRPPEPQAERGVDGPGPPEGLLGWLGSTLNLSKVLESSPWKDGNRLNSDETASSAFAFLGGTPLQQAGVMRPESTLEHTILGSQEAKVIPARRIAAAQEGRRGDAQDGQSQYGYHFGGGSHLRELGAQWERPREGQGWGGAMPPATKVLSQQDIRPDMQDAYHV
mmetsp:Transcript_59202/g.158403  ORF Transcript_59202/g.158403 Transcript_59202/m.158403 type:complete len:468 (-) Transcript_59202:213-1616(-)